LSSDTAGAADVELPTFPAPVFVLRKAERIMQPLILTSRANLEFIRSGFADLAVDFAFRFVWGPLPSPDELASYLGACTPDHGPGRH
jgi:hypothetical protein